MWHEDVARTEWSRRRFLHASAAGVTALAGIGCSDTTTDSEFDGDGRLSTTVSAPVPASALGPGIHRLGLGSPRDGRLFIPTDYSPATPTTLVMLLHGASGTGEAIGGAFDPLAQAAGVVTLAPDSRYRTWDAVLQDFGPDVSFIDAALAWTFLRVNVDPARLTIAGFSDGASYALALGLTNGLLFRRVIAFSPGFLFTHTTQGKPPVYVTHGTGDSVLPIASTSRQIVPALQRSGYTVDYHEFDGGHFVEQTLAEEALAWAATP
jgi:phospholipase/carboxylesterase